MKNSVLIVFSKLYVQLGDFQVSEVGFFKVRKRICDFPKSQKSRPSYFECGINVEIVTSNKKFGYNILKYLFSNGKSVFFNLWKKTLSALQNLCKPKVFKNRE